PWVAWEGYGTTAGQVFAAHMNAAGNGWVLVPGPFANEGITDPSRVVDYPNPGSPRIADVGGVPYILFTQFQRGFTSSPDQLLVVRLSPTSAWQRVGGPLNFDPTASVEFGDIAAVGPEPYVAW